MTAFTDEALDRLRAEHGINVPSSFIKKLEKYYALNFFNEGPLRDPAEDVKHRSYGFSRLGFVPFWSDGRDIYSICCGHRLHGTILVRGTYTSDFWVGLSHASLDSFLTMIDALSAEQGKPASIQDGYLDYELCYGSSEALRENFYDVIRDEETIEQADSILIEEGILEDGEFHRRPWDKAVELISAAGVGLCLKALQAKYTAADGSLRDSWIVQELAAFRLGRLNARRAAIALRAQAVRTVPDGRVDQHIRMAGKALAMMGLRLR